MRAPLRCAALQLEHRFGDVEGALQRVDGLLNRAGPLDLVLLPEACLTGYVSPTGVFDLSPQAEPLDGPTAGALGALARKHQVTLVAPLIERAGRACHNSYLVHGPDGALLAHYRKRHPWFPERWATPGRLPYPELQLGERRLLLAVCFDIHFLDEEIPAALDRADLLLFPSAWVDGQAPEDTRAELLPWLARRHRLAILNANWARSRPRLPGQGGSRLVGPDGGCLGGPLGAGEEALVVTL
ncbi:MAG: carbon-nitrogen hydrolase family protein [Polyangiaceae bacterium]|jgi:predicted amidohydrolase|nr:carbon-nitrogen hydrolase family protein [Polyangiaceae bacterium]